MSAVIKSLNTSEWAEDLLKESSTSGITYKLSKARNSLLPITSTVGNGIIISVENTSELVAFFRGQSKEEEIQFQLPLGPNAIQKIYLPMAPDYLLSTTESLKISDVSILHTYLPNTQDFDSVSSPSPLIQVSSNTPPVFQKPEGYKLSGLTNIYLKQSLDKSDYIQISGSGQSVVWRFGELRMRSMSEFHYSAPASEIPKTFSCGSEFPYTLKITTHQKKYHNPAYVAPEAELWSMENTVAS